MIQCPITGAETSSVYKIIDLFFQIKNRSFVDPVWEQFRCECPMLSSNSTYITVTLEADGAVGVYRDLELFSSLHEGDQIVRRNEDIMIVNHEWTDARICTLHTPYNLHSFLMMLLYTHCVYKQIIQVHSSLVDWNGNGILFLGPSGIGKTTQAELWERYRGATILNGDMVFIQKTETDFLGWGTPWHGSSPYCENASVPLKALVVLRQGKENTIRELTGFEKVSLVSNNIFYPTWLANGIEVCLQTFDALLSALPVYQLTCRPDEDAVELTYQTVFKHNEGHYLLDDIGNKSTSRF